MAYAECKRCGWNFAEPGLDEAVFGSQECCNCGRDRPMDRAERIETIQCYDQKLYVCERELSHLLTRMDRAEANIEATMKAVERIARAVDAMINTREAERVWPEGGGEDGVR